MESPGNDTSVTWGTNWTVASGSFENSVIFETPLSLIDGKDEDADGDGNDSHGESSTAVDSISKSPLILCPTSRDSAPCEITITFAQKHEVRQVYVRSTARVYEIYCASETNSGNEYLCTVRCGIAARDEEVLRVASDSEETVVAHRESSTKEVVEERIRHGSNLTSSEDDWVEVKLVDSPTVISEKSSSSSHLDITQGRRSQLQDLYEATAAINDANPCTSMTLKLLSLQDKSCLCIDEIYVFADPVSAADLDNEVVPTGNLAGSSLMAMFMPTLLQLSKTRDVSPAQGKLDIDRMSEQNSEEAVAKPSDPIDSGNKVQREEKSGSSYQQEVQLQEALTPVAKLVQPEIPPQVSDTENKPDTSHNHIEGALNQLVSRLSRMEDLFLRFEDCMLKPIRSIDERLQRVEQQLEVLTKKTQYTLLPCTRISAPDFSCSESETNSLYNSGCIDLSYAACETNKKDSFPSVSSINSDAIPVFECVAKSHPSLVVTAPEFSNGDDEEEEEEAAAETAKEDLQENQKCAMSIDDALASALAGFLSSTSAQSPRYSKSLIVKAPDFPNEEGNSNDESASPKVPYGRIKEPFTGSSEPEEKEHLRSLFSSLSNISSLESDENVTRSPNNNNCVKTGREVDEQLLHSKGDEGNFKEICIDLAASTMHNMKIINSYQITNDTGNGGVGNGTSNTEAIEKQITDDTSNGGVGTATRNVEAIEKSDSLEQFSGYRTDDDDDDDDDADTTDVGIDMDELNICTEVGGGSDRDILQNVVELSRAAAQVDFQTPILEVKFTSQENLNAKSPLEALLSGIPGLHVEEVQSVKESHGDGSQIANHSDLIPVEDWEAMRSATDNLVAVDSDYYNLTLLPLIAEDAIHLKNE